MFSSLPVQLGPLVIVAALGFGAWAKPGEFAVIAAHGPYFLPSLLLVLASWGKLGHGYGVHNLFRDDARIFGPEAPGGRLLERWLASPAFWSGAGFAAAFGYAWIIAFSAREVGGWALPVAILASAAVFLWAAGAALARPLADLRFHPAGSAARELLRVALGLGLGYAACWAAWWAGAWAAGPEGPAPLLPAEAFHRHAAIFLVVFMALSYGFRHARLALPRTATTLVGLACAAIIIACLLELALEAPGEAAQRRIWIATWVFMIPVALVFGLQTSLPCVSLACIGLSAMATGQLAAPIWSTMVWGAGMLLSPLPGVDPGNAALPGLVAVVLALAWLILVNGWRRRLRLPDFDYGEILNPQAAPRAPGATQNPAARPALTPVAALEAWRGHGPTLILVCLSGGAYRATFWSSLVLDHLCDDSDRFPGFEEGVHLITGASGGMVAGAYFAALRAEGRPIPEGGVTGRIEADSVAVQRERGRRFPVERDALSPVAHQFAQWDLRDLVVPGHPLCDRGITLERQWPTLRTTFQGLETAARSGRAPSIVLSPMLVETGATALLSNLSLDCIGGGERKTSVEIFDVFRGYETVSLATAVRLNASFPYVSPGVSLPTSPERRPVDAGYYDNYGVDLATDYLDCQEVFDHLCPEAAAAPFPQIAVIQIRAFPSDLPTPAAGWAARALHGLTTPIEGIASARRSSQIFRNDQSLAATKRRYEERLGEGAFQVFTLEAEADVSMSWHTRDDEMAALRDLLLRPSAEELQTAGDAPPDPAHVQKGDIDALRRRRIQRRTDIARTLDQISGFLHRPARRAAAPEAAE